VCAAAARTALSESSLPPAGRFEWLGVGGLAFLAAGAWATRAEPGRARAVSLAVALIGAAVATLELVVR
jgi:hypothetical protein